MKKTSTLFYLILTFACIHLVRAQESPILKTENATLGLKQLNIKVEVVGNIATTTYDMLFYNPYRRVLEGELSFPLGQNQNVSRFALDINGTLRESVVVEKETGRVAFENTIRQRIDPALLEQTKGNNYKARIYPIPARGTKRLVLAYEQELILNNNAHFYQLPLNFKDKLEVFNLEIIVYEQPAKPVITEGGFGDFKFDSWKRSYIARTSRKEFIPDTSLRIRIPTTVEKEKTITYKDFFYIYKTLEPAKKLKQNPKHITLYWDTSYSMKNRNSKAELTLLKSFFNHVKNVSVSVISFSNSMISQKDFSVTNSNWKKIKQHLENTTYDGGTSYKTIVFNDPKTDAYLLFTDGLDNLGTWNSTPEKPVYAINSRVVANHDGLEQLCTDSGGNYINLNNLDLKQANELLVYDTYRFLGVSQKTSKNLEIYPNYITNITHDFSVSGKNFSKGDRIEMYFGYGNAIADTISYTLTPSDNQNKNVKTIWAQKKLASLSREKEKNKNHIIRLSKEYQLISSYTSLIVLDRIEDYVRYKIAPPKELLKKYKRLLSIREENEANKKEQLTALKKVLSNDYSDLTEWWDTTFKPEKIKGKHSKSPETENNSTNTQRQIASGLNINPVDPNRPIVRGNVISSERIPLPGVNVIIKGKTRGSQTDFDGNFSINADEGDVLVFSYLGQETQEVAVSSSTSILNIALKESDVELEEVVITSYSSVNKATTKDFNQGVITPIGKLIQGKASGIQIVESGGESESGATVRIRGSSTLGTNNIPLYIVDGEVVTTLTEVNTNTIAEIYTLKADAAMAVYGSGAASGVVIINTKKGMEKNSGQIEKLETLIAEKVELKVWNPNTPYIKELAKTESTKEAYNTYLKLRDSYANVPAFYIDVADFFEERKAPEIALKILTNIAEIDLDNYELLRALAYKLEYLQAYEMAAYIYETILELRPEDIQSYRDLALAYEETGNYQKALELLYKIVNGELVEKDTARRFKGIESIAFTEMNHLIHKHKSMLNLSAIAKKHLKAMPVDVRVVIDWNHDNTDIDLWVIDPNNEKCVFNHPKTKIGGKLSKDMTQGFGPEEFLLKKAIKGDYKFIVDYYGDGVQKISGPTFLKVTVFTNYGRKNEVKKTAVFRLDKKDDEMEVGQLKF